MFRCALQVGPTRRALALVIMDTCAEFVKCPRKLRTKSQESQLFTNTATVDDVSGSEDTCLTVINHPMGELAMSTLAQTTVWCGL